MSIAIIFNNKDPEIWRRELEKKLRNTAVEIYPNIKDKEKVDFILCWKPAVGVISEFPNVKVIQSVGASAEHIINSQKLSGSIILTRIVDEGLTVDMFEFLLSAILLKIKNIDHYIIDQNNQIWNPIKYQSIENTVVTILGLGQIGRHVAGRLAELNFKVKGWSNSKKEINGVECFHGEKEYADALQDSDFLLNLLPLTPDTRDILDFKSLSLLRKGGTLINVGRGEHLVEEDLIKVLDSGHLSGAVLDVFREEPLPQRHPFWNNPHIIITPHIASLTNVSTAADVVAENYNRLLNNKELLHVVSHSKGY
jgi:glyoxylate/hydroxypyruvate reductase A